MYYNPLTTCKLNDHFAEIDRRAEELFSRLVKQTAEQKGAAKVLKVQGQMAWIGKMNDIQARARGIVNAEQIYA